MAGGSIIVRYDIPGTLNVTITRSSGAALTVYSDAALQSSVSFPDAITATKRYYLASDDDYVISVKRGGIEIAGGVGSTLAQRISEDKVLSFGPTFPEANTVSFTELGTGVAYTPTLGGFTIGDGVIAGKYNQVGKRVFWEASLTFGSTTAGASANVTFTLPVTAAATSNQPVIAEFYDVSATTYYGAVGRYSSTTVATVSSPGTAGVWTTLSTTVPFTWATGDIIYVSGSYEAA